MPSVRYEILDLLTEDWYAPWELLVQVEKSHDEILAGLDSLLEAGAVEWFARDGIRAPVKIIEASKLPALSSDLTWQPMGDDERQVLVGITPSGLREFSLLMKAEFDWPHSEINPHTAEQS